MWQRLQLPVAALEAALLEQLHTLGDALLSIAFGSDKQATPSAAAASPQSQRFSSRMYLTLTRYRIRRSTRTQRNSQSGLLQSPGLHPYGSTNTAVAAVASHPIWHDMMHAHRLHQNGTAAAQPPTDLSYMAVTPQPVSAPFASVQNTANAASAQNQHESGQAVDYVVFTCGHAFLRKGTQ